MQTISMRIPDELAEQLDRQAKSRRVTKSDIIRESLEKTLMEPGTESPSCYDLAADLAGTIKSAAKDLATNPKYMKGFGE